MRRRRLRLIDERASERAPKEYSHEPAPTERVPVPEEELRMPQRQCGSLRVRRELQLPSPLPLRELQLREAEVN